MAGFISVLALAACIRTYLIGRKIYSDHVKRPWIYDLLIKYLFNPNESTISRFMINNADLFLESYIRLYQQVELSREMRSIAARFFRILQVEARCLREIRSPFAATRARAASYLGYLEMPHALLALEKGIVREKRWHVKIIMLEALTRHGIESSLPLLIDSLIGAPEWYQTMGRRLLMRWEQLLHKNISRATQSDRPEMMRLAMDFASQYPADDMKEYLFDSLSSPDDAIATRALQGLAAMCPSELEGDLPASCQSPARERIFAWRANHSVAQLLPDNAAMEQNGIQDHTTPQDTPGKSALVPAKGFARFSFLARWLAAVLLSYPALYASLRFPFLDQRHPVAVLYDALYHFNYYFGAFALISGLVSLALASISAISIILQNRNLQAKNRDVLFLEGTLPRISVIAPVYREEKSVIDRVGALLNLDYPSHEVIVVNDGSDDATLNSLIQRFRLHPASLLCRQLFRTSPVRGTFVSASFPALIVIDKSHGGMNDCLNAALNYASGNYVFPAFPDIIPGQDTLLNLASHMLDSDTGLASAVATVLPVSENSSGEHALQPSTNRRFRFMDTIRTCAGERPAWHLMGALPAQLDGCLLLSAPAVIEAGGFTSDICGFQGFGNTRITSLLLKILHPFLQHGLKDVLHLSTAARCERHSYTQANSGELFDIITGHASLISDKRNNKAVFRAFKHAFAFGMLGSWIELTGYAALAASIALGIADAKTILFAVSAATLPGIAVSMASLGNLMKSGVRISPPALKALMRAAVLENIGLRQIKNAALVPAYLCAFFIKKKKSHQSDF